MDSRFRTLFLLGAALATTACANSKRTAPAVITLGLNLDRTGSIATPTWSSSVDLAVQDANRGLQLAGHSEIVFATASADSTNTPGVARANAIELVKARGVKAIIDDTSQDQIAVEMLAYDGDPAHDLQVPVVCIACTSPQIGDPQATDPDPVRQAALRNAKGWGFRTSLSDLYQSRVVARILAESGVRGDVNQDGIFHLAIYASDDPYGRAFASVLEPEVRKLRPGATVSVVFHPLQMNEARYDWAGDVAKLLKRSPGKAGSRPDAVVEMTFPKYSAAFTRAYLASGTRTRLLHTHNFRSLRVLEPLGARLEGQEGTSQALLGATASGSTFASELKEATGSEPAFRDAVAYDAAMSLMLATLLATRDLADPAQVTGAGIRAALRRISSGERVFVGPEQFRRAVELAASGKTFDYEGASGPCDFDPTGNVVAQVARFRVINQEFVDVDKFDCVRSADCPRVAPGTTP